jgi:hypothetical protein
MAGAPVPDHPNIHAHLKRAQGLKGPMGSRRSVIGRAPAYGVPNAFLCAPVSGESCLAMGVASPAASVIEQDVKRHQGGCIRTRRGEKASC